MSERKQYESVGQVPKFPFGDDVGKALEGHYVRCETVEYEKAGKKKDFKKWVVADSAGREWAISGGHIDYLFQKALDEKRLTPGIGVMVTYMGWDEMDDGNKARTYSLGIEKQPS